MFDDDDWCDLLMEDLDGVDFSEEDEVFDDGDWCDLLMEDLDETESFLSFKLDDEVLSFLDGDDDESLIFAAFDNVFSESLLLCVEFVISNDLEFALRGIFFSNTAFAVFVLDICSIFSAFDDFEPTFVG